MSKHLSLSDRVIIEKYLTLDMSFAYISRRLSRSATTISREVKSHRHFVRVWANKKDCVNYPKCLHRNLCPTETKYSCVSRCKFCSEYDCRKICKDYDSIHCDVLNKPSYECTRCPNEKKCNKIHAYYTAHSAHAEYLKQLSSSRKGVRTSPERLMELNDLLAPLLNKGQSINHIFATHADEIGLSEKTIYNYIDSCAFEIRNIDLPRKVKYRQRHEGPKVMTKLEYQYRKGRTYEDFKSYVEANPNLPIVEMDTVKGARGSGKVLLTMIFRDTNFMLIFLMPDGTQESVQNVFDMLTIRLGIDTFRKLFPGILTDNGVEFKGAHRLEFAENGARRTRLFYCDPQASWQKGRVEKNHVLIRQILPKGTVFGKLDNEDIHLITCHINSVVREIFENQTPFELMTKEEHKKLLDELSLQLVPPDEVCLKPALLKRKK